MFHMAAILDYLSAMLEKVVGALWANLAADIIRQLFSSCVILDFLLGLFMKHKSIIRGATGAGGGRWKGLSLRIFLYP